MKIREISGRKIAMGNCRHVPNSCAKDFGFLCSQTVTAQLGFSLHLIAGYFSEVSQVILLAIHINKLNLNHFPDHTGLIKEDHNSFFCYGQSHILEF